MSTTALAAEMVARIFYKNDATGAPVLVASDGSTDGSVVLFTGNTQMQSQPGVDVSQQGEISTAAYTRQARTQVDGASAVLRDTPIFGALEFLADFLSSYKKTYTAGGLFDSPAAVSASEKLCRQLDWAAASEVTTSWTCIELVGWRYCDDETEMVRANIFRNITDASLATNPQFGLDDPGTGTTDINITLEDAGTGWGDGPADLFPIYDDTGGVTLTRAPFNLGHPIGTAALYEDLVTLCSCKNAVRGIPLTAALIAANSELTGNDLISVTVV